MPVSCCPPVRVEVDTGGDGPPADRLLIDLRPPTEEGCPVHPRKEVVSETFPCLERIAPSTRWRGGGPLPPEGLLFACGAHIWSPRWSIIWGEWHQRVASLAHARASSISLQIRLSP